jgi:YD repeat-containing protein
MSRSRLARILLFRKIACLILILSLIVFPGDMVWLALAALDGPARGASEFFRRALGYVYASRPAETLRDRIARVSRIAVSPSKFVGYIGDSVTFIAMGMDLSGQAVHGAKFSWESSDPTKLAIDEAGRANLLRPGLVRVTCRAGSSERVVPILIKPSRRRLQTDAEWRADQDSFESSQVGLTDSESSLGLALRRLTPLVQAQGGCVECTFGEYPDSPPKGGVGRPPYAALEQTRLGPVIPRYNFQLPIKLVSLGGRGLATSLTLYYNSNVWGYRGASYVFDPIRGWPSPGFHLGFGRIVFRYSYTGASNLTPYYDHFFIAPDGTWHYLGLAPSTSTNVLQTTDGSQITFVGNILNGGKLYYKDGTVVTMNLVNNRLLATQITDTNGNYIQIAYKSGTDIWGNQCPPLAIDFIVDTLGRVIRFNYEAYNSTDLTSISMSGGTIMFRYQAVMMNVNFNVSTENVPESFSGLSSITVLSGLQYQFSYSGYGMIYSVTAGANGRSGTISFDYPMGGEYLQDVPTFSRRTESGSDSPATTYAYNSDGSISRPDGTRLYMSETVRELRDSMGATLWKETYSYGTDPGGSRVIQSIVTQDEVGQETRVDFDYDQYGNVINKREYGFKVGGVWGVRRRTRFTYLHSISQQYADEYIRNRVVTIEVFDGLWNTNDGDDVLVARTQYGYDEYFEGMEQYGGMASPPGHLTSYDASNTLRGNLTSVTKWTHLSAGASVTHRYKLDIFGNTVKAEVSCCNQKSFTMTEATYWSRPEQVIEGSGLSSSASYDFNTLALTSETDPYNRTTRYTYDGAMRLSGFTTPTGASGQISYDGWGGVLSSSLTYNEGGVYKAISSSAVYDGWGQMIRSIDANGAQVNYSYDAMGRLLMRTNPFPQGEMPGPMTRYEYDPLGRVRRVILPDGNAIQYSYNGSTVIITDHVGRKTRRERDGLGRLIKVTEQDASGALTQETVYKYDAADRLVEVNQGGQIRAYKYDAAGRLLYERIPEQRATISDGAGGYYIHGFWRSGDPSGRSWGDNQLQLRQPA